MAKFSENDNTQNKPLRRGPGRPRTRTLLKSGLVELPPVNHQGMFNSAINGHTVKRKRSIFPSLIGKINQNSLGRSMLLIAPWDYWHYPGYNAGFAELLEQDVHLDTAKKWLQTGKAPDWVYRVMERNLEQRLFALIRGLEEIRDELKRRELLMTQHTGFCAVRSDGQARRGTSNRKAKLP